MTNQFAAQHRELAEAIRDALSDELRNPPWRGDANRFAGHCYVASEAFYHLAGGKDAGWKPMNLRHEDSPHWWLLDAEGHIVDLTAEQFKTPVPYAAGVGKGFLTREPSKRSQVIIDRVKTRHPHLGV